MSTNILPLALTFLCLGAVALLVGCALVVLIAVKWVRPMQEKSSWNKKAKDWAAFQALVTAHPDWIPATTSVEVKVFDKHLAYALYGAEALALVKDGLQFIYNGEEYFMDQDSQQVELVSKGYRMGAVPSAYANSLYKALVASADKKAQKAVAASQPKQVQANTSGKAKHNNNNNNHQPKQPAQQTNWSNLIGKWLDHNPGTPPKGLVVRVEYDPHDGTPSWIVEKA
jgi:hypothetical protein